MSRTRTRTVTTLTGLALSTGVLAGLGLPAYAVDLDIDRPRLTEPNSEVDFGRTWDTVGTPLNGGYLYWDVTNGDVTPDLEGYLYLKNAAGDCGRVEIEFYDEDGDFLHEEAEERCTESNSKVQFFLNMDDYSSPYITSVTIRLKEDNGNDGTWSTIESQGWNLGD